MCSFPLNHELALCFPIGIDLPSVIGNYLEDAENGNAYQDQRHDANHRIAIRII
jgi:hypothetical protein